MTNCVYAVAVSLFLRTLDTALNYIMRVYIYNYIHRGLKNQ